jgi:hypothetical protein
MWGCRPHQARTLEVSRTQSLHDAATPTTDNTHWGYAPNPIFDKSNFHNILNDLNHKPQGETENG